MKVIRSLNLDDIYKKIGDLGPYQILMICLIGMVTNIQQIVGLSYSFYGAVPDFR